MKQSLSTPYTLDMILSIAEAQSPKNQIATRVAYETGISACELASLRPWGARMVCPVSKLETNRFAGRTGFSRYSVESPPGENREVAIRPAVSAMLEGARLGQPFAAIENNIRVLCGYNIGLGKRWAESFKDASIEVLGYSNGTIGIRQAYLLDRNFEMTTLGFSPRESLTILSAETGCDTAQVEQLITPGI